MTFQVKSRESKRKYFSHGGSFIESRVTLDIADDKSFYNDSEMPKQKEYLTEIERLAKIWTDNPAKQTMPELIAMVRNDMNRLERTYGHSRVIIETDMSKFRQQRQIPEHETYAREIKEKDL